MHLNHLRKIRNIVIALKRRFYRAIFGMDLHPTCTFSLKAKFDLTHPRGIHIGEETYIAFDAVILAHDMTRGLRTDTWIGKRCFIGARSIIMPGVKIGDAVIVAAGSVVTRDVNSGSVVAGNPAKVIRTGIVTTRYGCLPGRGYLADDPEMCIEGSRSERTSLLGLMRPILKVWVLFLGGLCITLAYAVPLRAEDHVNFGRGINIADWFTWPRYQKAPLRGLEWPPYRSARPGADLLPALREHGFKTVRVAVDPAPLIYFKGAQRELLINSLLDQVRSLQDRGFHVIFDLHPNSRHETWGDRAILRKDRLDAYLELIEFVSVRLAKLPRGSVALEFVNEPRAACKGSSGADWQITVSKMIARARVIDKELPLIVSGGCVSMPEGLMALDPAGFDDQKIYYTFHYYEPFTFTHQGAQFIVWPDKYLDKVPWPASRRPIDEARKALADRLEVLDLPMMTREKAYYGANVNLERYYSAGHDSKKIKDVFDAIHSWAIRHEINPQRIILGEFGVWRRQVAVPGALCVDRAAWIRAVRKATEANGFNWTFFHLDGPFGLATENGTIDPIILGALGLGPEKACPESN